MFGVCLQQIREWENDQGTLHNHHKLDWAGSVKENWSQADPLKRVSWIRMMVKKNRHSAFDS